MTATLLRPPPIGALRRRLTLEQLTRAPDGAGGVTDDWLTIATLWAAIHPRHGAENFDGGRTEGRITHDIWIRPLALIKSDHRLRLNTRLFNIRAVLRPDEVINRWRLICEERDQ
jgi:SPP1 family predicted phage head-tail adaptor